MPKDIHSLGGSKARGLKIR
ncbi:hypothetical protein CFP56_041712 [Quercus suber]|uniref:Uncharacterized protein n=1 Tax=Quercus suber TaxID=58331 RepID=A0AAW0LKY2_QUESU